MPAPRPRRPARPARALAAACVAAAAAACGPARGRPAAGAEPATEFLAVAGDSTYWVRNGPDGLRVRSAPLLLTRWGGRLADVYVVDDGVRFDGAEFASMRVYRRDLLGGDSALVFADSAVPRMAARWAAAHPDARPLDDEDDAELEPALAAEHGVGLVAVHGPYVTLDLRTTVDESGRGRRETLLRRVVDLRTGRPASLAALFGAAAPPALEAAGRRAFAGASAAARAALDTLQRAPAGPPAAADPNEDDAGGARARARDALGSLRFDPENFGLVAVDGAPAVQFVARGGDADGAVTLAVPPVPVAAAAGGAEPPWWATDVRPLLPATAPDAARLLARETVQEAEQLVRLDHPPADAALRRALRRAFDQSVTDDAVATTVARRSAGGRSADRRDAPRRRR